MVQDQSCLLCGDHSEDIKHLFFECVYSGRCLQETKQWLTWRCKGQSIEEILFFFFFCLKEEILKWLRKAKMSVIKRSFYVVLAAIVYNIWKAMNDALWFSKLWLISTTVKRIQYDIQMRLRIVMPKKADREWIDFICKK